MVVPSALDATVSKRVDLSGHVHALSAVPGWLLAVSSAHKSTRAHLPGQCRWYSPGGLCTACCSLLETAL